MQSIILWQLEVFALAFFIITVVSTLSFYGTKSRIQIIRIGLISIGVLTLSAALPFTSTIPIWVDGGSVTEYVADLLSVVSPPLAMIIGTIAALKLASLIRQYRLLKREIGSCRAEESGKAFEHLNQLCNQLNLSEKPSLYVAPSFAGACTFGHSKPAIVISETVASDPSKLHIALLHELNHITQKDWIWDQISKLLSAIFPLDGLIRNLRSIHHRLIEQRCDLLCTEQGVDNLVYASFLHGLKRNLFHRSAALQAAELSSVGERVELLISNNREQPELSKYSSFSLSILILGLGLTIGITNFELNLNEPRTPYSPHIQYLGHEPASNGLEEGLIEPIAEPEFPRIPIKQDSILPEDVLTEMTLSAPQDEPLHIEPP